MAGRQSLSREPTTGGMKGPQSVLAHEKSHENGERKIQSQEKTSPLQILRSSEGTCAPRELNLENNEEKEEKPELHLDRGKEKKVRFWGG